MMARRWATACAVSAMLVVAAPFVGDMQRWLERTLGAAYVPAVNLAVASLTAAAVVAAIARIREQRWRRYSLIAAAVVIAAVYAWRTGLASARSSAVERFHLVEYGVITWLFYRAAVGAARHERDRRSAGLSAAILLSPLACAIAVATGDEWLQHLAPRRVGEVRDIFMNVAAIVCGLLVSVAMLPPGRANARGIQMARRAATIAGALAAGGILTFVMTVHTGTWIVDDEVAFLSRYDEATLRSRAAGAPSAALLARYIEDQYVTEAIWHVQARNASWEAGDIAAAWGEHRILEKYFTPVLAAGHAWPPGQRADAERRAGPVTGRPYRSRAERIPIVVRGWPAK